MSSPLVIVRQDGIEAKFISLVVGVIEFVDPALEVDVVVEEDTGADAVETKFTGRQKALRKGPVGKVEFLCNFFIFPREEVEDDVDDEEATVIEGIVFLDGLMVTMIDRRVEDDGAGRSFFVGSIFPGPREDGGGGAEEGIEAPVVMPFQLHIPKGPGRRDEVVEEHRVDDGGLLFDEGRRDEAGSGVAPGPLLRVQEEDSFLGIPGYKGLRHKRFPREAVVGRPEASPIKVDHRNVGVGEVDVVKVPDGDVLKEGSPKDSLGTDKTDIRPPPADRRRPLRAP